METDKNKNEISNEAQHDQGAAKQNIHPDTQISNNQVTNQQSSAKGNILACTCIDEIESPCKNEVNIIPKADTTNNSSSLRGENKGRQMIENNFEKPNAFTCGNYSDAGKPITAPNLISKKYASPRGAKRIRIRKLKKKKHNEIKYNIFLIASVRTFFSLDCCKKSTQKLPNYNGLLDKHLVCYFSRPKIKHHLIDMHLVQIMS